MDLHNGHAMMAEVMPPRAPAISWRYDRANNRSEDLQ